MQGTALRHTLYRIGYGGHRPLKAMVVTMLYSYGVTVERSSFAFTLYLIGGGTRELIGKRAQTLR